MPKAPDTLNPNGAHIIRLLGLLTEPVGSCVTGALQGPLPHKSIFRCEVCGGSRRLRLLPPTPPFCPTLWVVASGASEVAKDNFGAQRPSEATAASLKRACLSSRRLRVTMVQILLHISTSHGTTVIL